MKILFIIFLLVAGKAFSQTKAYDGMDYTPGTYLYAAPGGFGWQAEWSNQTGGAGDDYLIGETPGLSYTDSAGRTLLTSGAWATNTLLNYNFYKRDSTTDFGQSNTTTYISGLIKIKQIAPLGAGVGSPYIDITMGGEGDFGINPYAFGIGTTNGFITNMNFWIYTSSAHMTSVIPTIGTTYFIVGKAYHGNPDIASFYLNPTLDSETSNTPILVLTNTSLWLGSFDHVGIEQNVNGGVDEVRIGKTWRSVTPYINPILPQPIGLETRHKIENEILQGIQPSLPQYIDVVTRRKIQNAAQ